MGTGRLCRRGRPAWIAATVENADSGSRPTGCRSRNAYWRHARTTYRSQQPAGLTVDPLEPTEDLLESLYVVNKVAKQFADRATAAYERGDLTESNVKSARKDALYRTKTAVLSRIVAHDPSRVSGEYHAINGDVWLFLSIDGWHFHQPAYAIGSDLTDAIEIANGRSEPLDAPYKRDSSVERSERTLTQSLSRLADVGVNANDYLARPTVTSADDRIVDVRWSFLP